MNNFFKSNNINHFYQNIQGWFPYGDLYSNLVQNCSHNQEYIFVEIGSWKGRSTSFMGVEIANSKKNISFYAVDTWRGSEEHKDETNPSYEPLLKADEDGLYLEFLKNVAPVSSFICPLRMRSDSAAKIFPNESIDFIMIDGAHDYDSVKLDIQSWLPKLKKGAIMTGDDLDWTGTTKAVQEMFPNGFQSFDNKIWQVIK